MANKKQSKEFLTRMNKVIEGLGGVPTGNATGYQHTLPTIAGDLDIRVDEDSKHCFTMFCKFKDVERAKHKFDCNQFSGKWNVHIGANGITVDKAIEICTIHLERALPVTA